jgi:hypothetical protein
MNLPFEIDCTIKRQVPYIRITDSQTRTFRLLTFPQAYALLNELSDEIDKAHQEMENGGYEY